MIRFELFGIRFAVPLPALLMPILARFLGAGSKIWTTAIALTIHEAAHMAAAALSGVAIAEVRLLPFGGSIQIENPYALHPAQLTVVAVAGPIGNLFGAVCAAAMAHVHMLSPIAAAQFMRTSIVLMLFNLLPAMPLDGGRIAFALLDRALGRRRALRACLWSGYILSAMIAALFAWSAICRGMFNMTLLMAAILLFVSGRDENNALSVAEAMRYVQRRDDRPRPARVYQLREDAPVREAMRLLRPKEAAWFVLTRNGRPCAAVDSESMLAQFQEEGMSLAEMRDLDAMRLNMPC